MTVDGTQPPSAQAPPEQGGVIPLAPAPGTEARTGPDPGRRRGGRLLPLLVLVLAFLTASSPARNSDVWFHLATGRLLAQGKYVVGTDPFTYTHEGAYWANHAWLFDLGLYVLYNLLGGAGLVVLKALLVTVLAALLLRVRRPGEAPWLPAICTTLTVLAMSPRLLLQPACVSYFFLGLTFWLLWRPHTHSPRFVLRTSYFVLLVFVVWVNVDEWFLLGPLLVFLFWLGERLQGQRQTPGWLVPAGLAVCLLNPHTYYAFTLPPELSPVTWGSGLREDVRFQAQFASPWQPAYLRAAAGLNAAALAYFALTALGVVSFCLHPHGLRGWRLTVWLPFALLAAWQARAVPFFAVVAAPITALNLQDALSTKYEPRTTRPFVLRTSYFALVTGLVALIFLTWPGWLAGRGREGPHVAWSLEADPSLRRTAETIQDWRSRGLLSDGERIFALSPEVAHYAAWFSPDEKQFFDHRYQLFPTAARDYETVCRALVPGLAPNRADDWGRVLRDYRVAVVVLYDREPQRLFAGLSRLGVHDKDWALLDVPGQAALFGWNEARPARGFAALALDADRLALGPQDDRARRQLPAAPSRGPASLPPPRGFWARLARPPAPPSWESAAGSLYLHYFHDSEGWQQRREMNRSLAACAASLAGLPARPDGVPLAAMQVVVSQNLLCPPEGASPFLVREQLGPFFVRLVERSPALPLLAVRAARTAVAANPEDANAWLRLGQAYLLLRNVTAERAGARLSPLEQLRHVQIATALEQAVRLDPDLEAAHHELASLYGEQNFLDQALEHQRKEVRLSRRAGRRPGETAEEAAHRLEKLEKDAAKLEELVAERRSTYAGRAALLEGGRVQQATLAVGLGLARQAADDILLSSPAELLGRDGLKLELHLLLSLGRAGDVRPILDDERTLAGKDVLPSHTLPAPASAGGKAVYPVPYILPGYEWLRVLEASAVGDYAVARGALGTIRAGQRGGHERLRRHLLSTAGGEWRRLPRLFFGPPPLLPAAAALALADFLTARAAGEAGEPFLRAQEADVCVLEGLLAAEQGDTTAARAAFLEAQRLCAHPPTVSFAAAPIAADYLSKMNVKE